MGSGTRQTRWADKKQAKVKYLLISPTSSPERSHTITHTEKVTKTIAIPVSMGPGKINPHTDLVLSVGCHSGMACYLTNKARARPLPGGKQSWLITHKAQLSTHGKTNFQNLFSKTLTKAYHSLFTLVLQLEGFKTSELKPQPAPLYPNLPELESRQMRAHAPSAASGNPSSWNTASTRSAGRAGRYWTQTWTRSWTASCPPRHEG